MERYVIISIWLLIDETCNLKYKENQAQLPRIVNHLVHLFFDVLLTEEFFKKQLNQNVKNCLAAAPVQDDAIGSLFVLLWSDWVLGQ